MAKKGPREIVGLVCSVCKSQNYVTTRNKINMQNKGEKSAKLNINKYCKRCRKLTLHKETLKLK